jgi:hypothetical protein
MVRTYVIDYSKKKMKNVIMIKIRQYAFFLYIEFIINLETIYYKLFIFFYDFVFLQTNANLRFVVKFVENCQFYGVIVFE